MAEPLRHYSINDILRNNHLLDGAIYWSVFIDEIYEALPGSLWPDTSKIYIKKDKTSDPFGGLGGITKVAAQTAAANETPIMHGFSDSASSEFEIQCHVDGYTAAVGETPQHQRLIKFRVDTFLGCTKGCPDDGKTVYGPGGTMVSQQQADPGDTSSVYFYYGTSGGDQLFVKVDKSWPCDASFDGTGNTPTQKTCLDGFRNAIPKIAKSYWNWDQAGGTEKSLSYLSPCSALRVITGVPGDCYPEWIEFNYICDTGCTPGGICDGGGNDKARLLGDVCCNVASGIKPAVGDLIKIDKVGNTIEVEGKITSAKGIAGKAMECYSVTHVQADQPEGVTKCVCNPSAPTTTLGAGLANKCISSQSKIVQRRAPGESYETSGCYGAEDRFNLRAKIIETLTSLGWGENIGGFEITGFIGTLTSNTLASTHPDYEEEVTVNRMRGHGHFTRTAFSLPGNASSMKWEGGNSWLMDRQFYVDESSWRSVFTSTTTQTMSFIDRWRQTIEYSARSADPTKPEETEDVYELVNAWPPDYLEMFVKRTTMNAASMSIGYSAGRNFQVGLSFNVIQVSQEEDGEFPEGGESMSISASAYIKFSNLLNYTMKRYGHVNTGGDPKDEWKILRDYLTIDFNFGSSTKTTTWKEANEAGADSIITQAFNNTLFKGFEASASYTANFSNGWSLGVAGIDFNQDGFAKGINPAFTLTSPEWKDMLGFTITQNLNGGGTLGIMFNVGGDKPVLGEPDRDSSKLFVHAGIAVAAGWGGPDGASAKYTPSLQFKGQIGSIQTEKFSDILGGFEYDFNLLANKGTLTKHYDFGRWDSLDHTAHATGGFTIEANVNNPNANLFTVRGDFAFEATVKDFGKFWGKLVVRATATVGFELGMPGEGGLEPGGAEFGIAFGIYAQLTDTTFLEWLGFPFNINPGIGLGIGFKVNFKAISTLTRLENGDGARAGPQGQVELSLGPIQWNLSKADGLRQHMQEQHNSWVNPLPFFGNLLGQVPVITVLGGKEGLFQYVIRGSIVRAWTCIGLAVRKYMTDVEKSYTNGESMFVSIDNSLSCNDAQREAKAKHRSTYYSRYRKKYELFAGEGKVKGACGPSVNDPHWTFDPTDCWQKTVNWSPKCHFASKMRDEYVLMNPPCPTIRSYWVQMVKDRDYIPFNFTRFPEIGGIQGIINRQMHYTEEYVWQKLFEKCEKIQWDDEDHLQELVGSIVDGCGYGGYEFGVIGKSEHGLPITNDEAGIDKAKVVKDIVAELLSGRGGWDIPIIGPIVTKFNKTVGEGFNQLAGVVGWDTTKTVANPTWPCMANGCGFNWYESELGEAVCDKAWVSWNYYMDVFYWYIQRWHAMANACMPFKATCGMISRGALKGKGYDPASSGMEAWPLGLKAMAKNTRLNLPYGEWVTILELNLGAATILAKAGGKTAPIIPWRLCSGK